MFPMTFSLQRFARRARGEEHITVVVTVRVAEVIVQVDELQDGLQVKAGTLADTRGGTVERMLCRSPACGTICVK